jgi:hypothetical protein
LIRSPHRHRLRSRPICWEFEAAFLDHFVLCGCLIDGAAH